MTSRSEPITDAALPSDRGWCERLHAEVSARTCSARHQATERYPGGATRPVYEHCGACPDGALVTLRLKAAPPAPVKPPRPLPYSGPKGEPRGPSSGVRGGAAVPTGKCVAKGCSETVNQPRRSAWLGVSSWGADLCRRCRNLVAGKCAPGGRWPGAHRELAAWVREHGTTEGFGVRKEAGR